LPDNVLTPPAYVGVSLVGIDTLSSAPRIVIATVATAPPWAEAAERRVPEDSSKSRDGFASDMTRGVAKGKTGGAIEGAKETGGDTVREATEKVKGAVGRGEDEG